MSTLPATHLPSAHDKGFGATRRRDAWFIGPIAMGILLLSFLVYSTWAAFQGAYYWVNGTNYLSPFYSPEFWGGSPHALFSILRPTWWPQGVIPFSAALLILGVPAGFRLTCYYYRKAYYRSIWLDPVACNVGEPRTSYWGENRLPLILWNAHRYFLYLSIIFVFILLYDGIIAFRYPVNADGSRFLWQTASDGSVIPGQAPHHHVFGVGIGTLILLINPLLIAGYTFGCHSLRHLIGGRKDCFSGSGGGMAQHRAWSFVSFLNRHHGTWAMASLVMVGFADIYVRLVAHGVWTDLILIGGPR